MLRKIHLNNFRKHHQRVIDFGKITAILGPNGVGKSTVLDAIELALYPDQFHTVAHNVRKGTKQAGVSLEVSANGHTATFSVTVRTKGKKLDSTVTYGNGRVGDINRVRKEIGLPGSLREFEILHYVRQGVFNSSPKEIAGTVRRILGIDRIKELLEILKEIERDLEKEIEGLKGKLPIVDDHFAHLRVVELGDLERRINHLHREAEALECEVLFLTGRRDRERWMIEEIESGIKEAEKEERELQSKVDNKRRLEGSIETLKGEIERLKEELRKLKEELQKFKVEVSEGEDLESVSREKERVKEDREEVIRKGAELKSLKEDLKEKEEKLEGIRSEIERYLDVLEGWRPEEVRPIREYAAARKEFEETKEAHQEYKKLEEKEKELENRLNRLREVWRWLKRMDGLKGDIERVLGHVPTRGEYDKKLKDLRYKKTSLEKDIEHEEKRLEALKGGESRCPVCGREIPDPQALIGGAKKRLGKLKNDLKRVSDEVKKYESVKDKVREYHALADRVREAVKELNGVSLPADAPLKDLQREVERIGKKLRDEKEGVENRLKRLEDAHKRHVAAELKMKKYEKNLPVPPHELRIGDLARLPEEVLEKYGEMKRLEKEIGDLKGKIERLEEDIKEIRDRYPGAKGNLESYLKNLEGRLEEKERYLKTLYEKEEKERDIRKLQRALEALGDPEGELKRIEENISAMREEKERRVEILHNTELELMGKKDALKDREEKVRKLEEIHGEWKGKSLLQSRVRAMIEEVNGKEKRFVEARRRVFEAKVAHYFLNVFGHNASYSKLEMDEDLMPVLTLHNGERVSVSYGQRVGTDQIALSGGEKTAMYLSYIMALREVVGRERGVAPILLLDEPTTHLDARRREDVWQMLDALHTHKGIQIVVVTHDVLSFDEILGSRPYVRSVKL